jgi:transposase
MARTASGQEHIEAAERLLKSARTADDVRRAQAVLLPLTLGLTIEQTAKAIGRSVGVTCTMRTRFAKVASGALPAPRRKQDLRNRAKAELSREREILDEVLADAMDGGVVVIPRVKPDIEAKLGETLSLSSLYRMLARHGWRKLAPDTRHPQGSPAAREAWKKNSPPIWSKLPAGSPSPDR